MNPAPTSHKDRSDANAYLPTVLVLDSGIGGLSVCQSMLELGCHTRIVYLADDAFFPYGTMPEGHLSDRLIALCDRLIPEHQPALVVLACNTVSTLVLPTLRARFQVPFVGVVPAIKPAALLSKSRHIGLLATPATVSRPYTDQLISEFAADCRVEKVGTRELVYEAEKLFAGEPLCKRTICEVLKPFAEYPSLDTVVLGCTHFPFLKAELGACLPGINWVDSGAAIARRVQHLLDELSCSLHMQIPMPASPESRHLILFSGKLPETEAFARYLGRLGFDTPELRRV